jgi:hypothetical protein
MPEALFTPLCVRMLEEGQSVRFRASGYSMHPAIRDGEWMTVEPAGSAAIRRGDVLLYRSARGLTAHRVARVLAEVGGPVSVVARGDNAGKVGELVDSTQVLGRVARVERGRRHFDPASLRSRFASNTRRSLAALKRIVNDAATGLCLLLSASRRQRGARQGGSP